MAGHRQGEFFKKTETRINLGEFFSISGGVEKYFVVKRYKIVPINF
jgi:hypothetical protein